MAEKVSKLAQVAALRIARATRQSSARAPLGRATSNGSGREACDDQARRNSSRGGSNQVPPPKVTSPPVSNLKAEASAPDVGIATDLRDQKSKSRHGAKGLGSRGPKPGHGGRPRIGEDKKTLKATQPWKALGMSQRTWYRRKAEKRNG